MHEAANWLEDALSDWRLSLIHRRHILDDEPALAAKRRHEDVVNRFVLDLLSD